MPFCCAHLLRNLAAVAETDPRQATSAEAMAGLLIDAKNRADAARDTGKLALSAAQRRRTTKAYDDIIDDAIRASPDPLLLGRERRTKAERESFNQTTPPRLSRALRPCTSLPARPVGGKELRTADPRAWLL